MSKRVLVIGAGLGGLAAAIRLAKAGHEVTVWEKNDHPGGKLQEYRETGFRWDMGPSLLTMPNILRELFIDVGKDPEDYLLLEKLENTCRYFWSDGTTVDEDEAFWHRPDVAKFLEYARGIYELSGEAYLNYPPREFWRAFNWDNLKLLRHLPKVATTQTMHDSLKKFFDDPKLVQLFCRYATYNGSSPYKTPATFNIIPYVEAIHGGWYVRGGMARIPGALERVALDLGVTIHYGTLCEGYRAGVAAATNGESFEADYVVCNGDSLNSRRSIFASYTTMEDEGELLAPEMSCSGLVFLFGVDRKYEQLAHHNVFFSDNYPLEFDDIFVKRELPLQPTIYIAISARSDPEHAPAGHENFFVLVNAPPMRHDYPFNTARLERYQRMVIARLESMGLENLRDHITYSMPFTPENFEARDLAYRGSLYGWASHTLGTSLLRPPMRLKRDPRVYFCGGTTHPGGGIPLVLNSGKMVAEMIARDAQQ